MNAKNIISNTKKKKSNSFNPHPSQMALDNFRQ